MDAESQQGRITSAQILSRRNNEDDDQDQTSLHKTRDEKTTEE